MVKRQIHIDEEDDMGRLVNNILENCPKKRSELCVIAIYELIKTYGLENATPEELSNLVKYYEINKKRMALEEKRNMERMYKVLESLSFAGNSVTAAPIANQENNTTSADIATVHSPVTLAAKLEPDETIQRKSLINQDDRDRMSNIMASFMGE